jgi:hypothetical protein
MLYIKAEGGRHMNQPKTPEKSYQSRIWMRTIRLACWGGAWLAATALMKFGPKFLSNKALAFTLLAVGLDVAVGVGGSWPTKRTSRNWMSYSRRSISTPWGSQWESP